MSEADSGYLFRLKLDSLIEEFSVVAIVSLSSGAASYSYHTHETNKNDNNSQSFYEANQKETKNF